jgi:hypothetical protein
MKETAQRIVQRDHFTGHRLPVKKRMTDFPWILFFIGEK